MEVWKSLGEDGVDNVVGYSIITEDFRAGGNATGMEGLKKKSNIQDCGNYRGIKTISHNMNIWERIIDRRLREETSI